MRDLMGMVLSPDRLAGIQQTAGNGIEMQARLRGTVYIDPEGERLHA